MDTLPAEVPTRQPNQTPPELTRQRQQQFLQLLASTGNIKKCCELLEINAQSPYQWASRSDTFSKKFEQAKEMGERVLLDEYEDIVDRRVNAYHLDQQSAVLTMFRMKRLDPRYRDNAPTNVNIAGPVSIQLNIGASVQAIQAEPKAQQK